MGGSGFLGLELSEMAHIAAGDVVVVGAPHATPYEAAKPSHAHNAPHAIRAASHRFATWHDHYDFDRGGELLAGDRARLRDLGDLDCRPDTPEANRELIRASVASVLERKAVPLVLGGDDSVPIPVFQAYQDHGPIWIVQVDAHIDWRRERYGEAMGWSSTMRRASEMSWVDGIIQVGARGVGSARRSDVEEARRWGAAITTARELLTDGVASALAGVPQDARIIIALDCDAFDPSIMPGVMAHVPGGLSYWQMIELLEVLAERSTIAGCSVVELVPERDIANISALTTARIVCNMIGAVLR